MPTSSGERVVRKTPSTEPMVNAITHAISEVRTVHCKPMSSESI